jgi:hypothetical protein
MVSSNGIGFRDGTTQTTAFNPAGNLSTAGAIISGGFLTSSISSSTIGGTLSLVNPAKTTAGTAQTWDIFNMTGGYGNSLQFWAYDSIGCNNGGLCNPRLTLTDSGSLGIGTTTPQAKLEINGNLRFTADGSVQTTAWTGTLCGGDYAEAVDAKGSRKRYEPGDVLVIGDGADGSDGEVQKSGAPYSTMVAGIFATKPGVIGRRQSLLKEAEEIPMAMVGIVPTKVTAENGPIHRGDLLVTSSAIGYAMKGTDRNRMLGAVIGKAMGSLDSGTGVIEVLVTLQ